MLPLHQRPPRRREHPALSVDLLVVQLRPHERMLTPPLGDLPLGELRVTRILFGDLIRRDDEHAPDPVRRFQCPQPRDRLRQHRSTRPGRPPIRHRRIRVRRHRLHLLAPPPPAPLLPLAPPPPPPAPLP